MKLDPADLRAYARRDWEAPERLARAERAQQPIEAKVAMAIDLYEATKRTRPSWPDEATRREDLATHVRVRNLLDRAARVGAR
jgi:hypothetical protein